MLSTGLRALSFATGLGLLYLAYDYATGPHEKALASALLLIVPLAAVMLSAPLFARPSAPGSVAGVAVVEVPGSPVRGTVFRSAPRSRAALVALAAFATMGVGFAVVYEGRPEDEIVFRALGGAMALGFGTLLVRALLAGGRDLWAVVLTPSAITTHGRLRTVRVGWDEIEEVRWHRHRGVASTILRREGGGEVHLPLNMLAADAGAFHRLVVHMHLHPHERIGLAHPGGAELVRGFAEPPAAQPPGGGPSA